MFWVKKMVCKKHDKGSGLIKNNLLRLCLSYSDTTSYFKYDVYGALAFLSMRTFIAKIKSVVNFYETCDLRVRNN